MSTHRFLIVLIEILLIVSCSDHNNESSTIPKLDLPPKGLMMHVNINTYNINDVLLSRINDTVSKYYQNPFNNNFILSFDEDTLEIKPILVSYSHEIDTMYARVYNHKNYIFAFENEHINFTDSIISISMPDIEYYYERLYADSTLSNAYRLYYLDSLLEGMFVDTIFEKTIFFPIE